MIPIFLAAFGAMLTAILFATTLPVYHAQHTFAQADVMAANLLQYQAAVSQYVYSHPAASGTVQDGQLTFSPGYVRNPGWTNVITGGRLYVYATSASAMGPQAMAVLFRRSGNSPLVGTAQGTFVSMALGQTSLILPAAIPTGAVVLIGN
jgi:hypothetical protein